VQQGALIRVLGRQSGYKIDKAAYLKSKRQLTSWRGYPVLFHAAAYLLLEPIQILPLGTYSGDHDLLLAHVITAKTLLDPASVLTTRHLIESGKILAKRN
jgi:flavin reductase (DIM6/NTAB) family NADH-FMN oxidoreductase RutF